MQRNRTFLLASGALCALAGCDLVPPGYVGIKVDNYGTARGVQSTPIVTGRVFYNPWTEDIYQFPTFLQTVRWDAAEAITFNSSEGAALTANVTISYRFEADKVPFIFQEFRTDPKHITDVYVHGQVRDAFARAASHMAATDIFGSHRSDLEATAKADLEANLGPRGIHFDQVSIIGKLGADQGVINSINAVLTASQQAIAAEQKVAQSRAEADQAIAKARGAAQSVLIAAEAQATANNRVAASLTPELVQWQAVQQWNGVLPSVTGGAIPMIGIPVR